MNRHRPLRRDAGEGVDVVRLLHVDGAVAVVGPEDLASVGVDRVDEDPHERPDARRPVDDAVRDDRGSAGRPRRDEPFVAEDLAIRRPAAPLPEKRPLVGIECVQVAVVGREEELSLPEDRGETNRSVGVEDPAAVAGLQVEGPDAIVPGRVQIQRLAGEDRLVADVERHLLLLGPGRHLGRQVAAPLQVELLGELLRRGGGPLGVVAPHRPVGGRETRCADGEREEDKGGTDLHEAGGCGGRLADAIRIRYPR